MKKICVFLLLIGTLFATSCGFQGNNVLTDADQVTDGGGERYSGPVPQYYTVPIYAFSMHGWGTIKIYENGYLRGYTLINPGGIYVNTLSEIHDLRWSFERERKDDPPLVKAVLTVHFYIEDGSFPYCEKTFLITNWKQETENLWQGTFSSDQISEAINGTFFGEVSIGLVVYIGYGETLKGYSAWQLYYVPYKRD